MNKYFINSIGISADGDRFIREVLVEEEYRFLFNYDTVVDIGANIGAFSFWIYPYAKKIYAIEPNPKAIEHLRKTMIDNKLDKIVPIECAITGSDGDRYMVDMGGLDYGGGYINDTPPGDKIVVKGRQLNTFMAEHDINYIDLLKIDIEGGERELFESGGFKNVQNKIGVIIGEYHGGGVKESIFGQLTHAGFRVEDVTKGNSSGHFIARWL